MFTRHLTANLSRLLSVTFALAASLGAHADWTLNNEHSRLSFVSIKAGDIGEVHQFDQLEGYVSEAGEISLSVHLASVNTLIPIRDERMREHLFSVVEFPQAKFAARLDPDKLNAVPRGASTTMRIAGTLTLLDKETPIEASVLVTRPSNRAVIVTSLAPIVLNAGQLGLGDGIEKLRELAGLPSISRAVPVTFVLTFDG